MPSSGARTSRPGSSPSWPRSGAAWTGSLGGRAWPPAAWTACFSPAARRSCRPSGGSSPSASRRSASAAATSSPRWPPGCRCARARRAPNPEPSRAPTGNENAFSKRLSGRGHARRVAAALAPEPGAVRDAGQDHQLAEAGLGGRHRRAGELARQLADHALVEDARGEVGRAREHALQAAGHPSPERGPRLAARILEALRPSLPVLVEHGVARRDLLLREPLPLPEVDLAEVGVDPHRRTARDDRGCAPGTAQVAGQPEVDAPRREPRSGVAHLGATLLREVEIRAAEVADARRTCGLPVANEQDLAQGHPRPPRSDGRAARGAEDRRGVRWRQSGPRARRVDG